MNRVLLICGESQGNRNILEALSRIDCSTVMVSDPAAATQVLAEEAPDLVAVDLGLRPPGHHRITELLEACKVSSPPLPVLALIPPHNVDDHDGLVLVDDFVLAPYRPPEVALRIQQLLKRFKPPDESSALKNGDLTIDLARYEVALGGRRLDLTFKEYELLRFLASSPGKVFTRETLLSRVWGYDYFGGTRTVDFHIRRLRSKIETTTTSFIETVRNVGYRFKEL